MIETTTVLAIVTIAMTHAGSLLSPDEKSVACCVLDEWCVGTFIWLCTLYLITDKYLLAYFIISFGLCIWAWSKHIFGKGKIKNLPAK